LTEQSTSAVLDHVTGALRTSALHRDPWPHCYLDGALPPATAAEIESTFDQVDLTAVHSANQTKTYRMRTRRVEFTEQTRFPSAGWRQVIDALRDARYQAAVAELAEVPLDDTTLTIDLWEYRSGDWLAPHVDKPEKVVTQLFYFSRDWHPDAGGRLLVLASADSQEHPAERLRPTTGASAVLVRSESSWHAVEPSRGSGASRCSIAATFWRHTRSASEGMA
jgi:Rps23 Pro-64 3,4-dihydroxylase Tpa1-like proline 4-hydroxylase